MQLMSGTNSKNSIVFCFVALIISCVLLSPAKAEEKPIDFVTFYDPPYIFNPEETNKQGLVQIILNSLMNNIGIKYKIVMMPPKRAEIFAKATPNTCILPIEKSQEREVFFSWVSPILVSIHGFFQLKGRPPILLQALDDARTYRLGSYLGSGIGDYLKSFDYQVDFANQNEANIHKISAQRIDLWASDIMTADYISRSENIAISESRLDFFTTLKAIGCHPSIDSKIINKMNKELQIMYQTGDMFSIVQKFKADIY
jgi:polar amino acid transport system substrate-binding protein